MRRVAILALFLVAGTAHAEDEDPVPRVAQPYWLHGKLDGVTAKLGMRFHLDVQGPGRENEFQITLPTGGVATAATLTVDGIKHRLVLDATERVAQVFADLTAAPAGPHRRWAIQITQGTLRDLSVSVVAPHAAMTTLDLDVDVPTCFRNDRRLLSVDDSWRGSIDRSLKIATVTPPEPPARASCATTPDEDDGYTTEKLWIELPTSEVSAQPFGERRIATIGNRIDVEHGHFARVEVDLAGRISQIPPDLMTVFVIDASRSVTTSELDAQEKIIESYARLAPWSQIQVVAYSRKARALLPGWMVASYAAPKLERALATLQTHNGSNVDAGLVEANAWLEHASGTRRVVVFTDELVSERVGGIEANVLRAALPANTLVHVIALDGGRASPQTLLRDDEVLLGQIAIASEGLAMRAMGDDHGQFNSLELLRPLALEHVTMHADGWTAMPVEHTAACSVDGTDDLAEGDSCVMWGESDTGATTFKLEGLLWNHKFSRTIVPAGEARTLARILTGLSATLGDAAAEIELAARAVNAQWSMIATWGGGDGYADEDSTEIYGSLGCGGSSTSNVDMIGGTGHVAIHRSGSLADQITRATNTCHVKARVEISLELTLAEIVEVTVASDDPADRACVTEAVWATPLALVQPAEHDTATVVLVP